MNFFCLIPTMLSEEQPLTFDSLPSICEVVMLYKSSTLYITLDTDNIERDNLLKLSIGLIIRNRTNTNVIIFKDRGFSGTPLSKTALHERYKDIATENENTINFVIKTRSSLGITLKDFKMNRDDELEVVAQYNEYFMYFDGVYDYYDLVDPPQHDTAVEIIAGILSLVYLLVLWIGILIRGRKKGTIQSN